MSSLTLTMEIYPFVTSHAVRSNCAKAKQMPDITEVVTHPLCDKAEPCLNQAIGRQNALVQLHDTIFCLNRLISNRVRLQNS